jgi:hypothetical protein
MTPEALVEFERIILCYIPEGRTLRNHICENLKSYAVNIDCI